VTDGTSGGILPNIVVQITDGSNSGKSAKTDGSGNYSLTGVSPGTFTMSASAVSYQTFTRQITATVNTRADFVLQRVVSAPAPAPAPTPTPKPTPIPSPGPGGGSATYNWSATGVLELCSATLCLDDSVLATNLGTGCATNVWFHVEFYTAEWGSILPDILVTPIDSSTVTGVTRPSQQIHAQTGAVFNTLGRHITRSQITVHYAPISCS
jgi:hypothetical protein